MGFKVRLAGKSPIWFHVSDASEEVISKRFLRTSKSLPDSRTFRLLRLGQSILTRRRHTVIYPATKKVAFQEPYSASYDYFQRCCEKAFLCITIGYSFRDYDALTRLRSAARLNPHLQLLVLDPNADSVVKQLDGVPCQPVPLPFSRERTEYLEAITKAVETAMDAYKKRPIRPTFI